MTEGSDKAQEEIKISRRNQEIKKGLMTEGSDKAQIP